MRPIITLLTDFGDRDPYVGIMKGVIAGLAPEAQCVDLTHNIRRGDIQAGAYALLQPAQYFPSGAIHLAVVDPGVGSRRRPLAVETERGYFVGPDNGLFSFIFAHYEFQAVELTNPNYRLPRVSHTFHGRDIFSPAAAHLALGVPLQAFGPPVTDPVRLPLPRFVEAAADEIEGQIIHSDRFGNLGTSIAWLVWEAGDVLRLEPWIATGVLPRRLSASSAVVTLGAGASTTSLAGIRRTFSDVAAGELAAIVSSEGHLQLAVNRGSAEDLLNLHGGEPVRLRIAAEPH